MYSITVKLLTEHHLEFISLIGSCTGSPESTHVIVPHCLRSHVMAQFYRCSHRLCVCVWGGGGGDGVMFGPLFCYAVIRLHSSIAIIT